MLTSGDFPILPALEESRPLNRYLHVNGLSGLAKALGGPQ